MPPLYAQKAGLSGGLYAIFYKDLDEGESVYDMFPLVPGTISSVNRGESAGGAARAYAATRANFEAPPVEAKEDTAKTRGRRPGERRQRRALDDTHTGQNLDIEV